MNAKPADFNTRAKSIVDRVTGAGKQEPQEPPAINADTIRQVMAQMGRKGGLKGGKARAASMTAAKRKEIAEKAAKARWR